MEQQKSGPKEAMAVAFFDLDRTLMAGASTYHFARAAYEAGMISRRQIVRDALQQIKFRLRGSSDETANALRERILKSIEGRSVTELGRMAPEIMAGILPRIYPQMMEAVRRHQDAGQKVFIATAAWQEISDLLAVTLQMDGAIATRAEVVDGIYSGRLAGPYTYGEGKAEAVRDFAASEGIDLANCYAYSDSVSDLPLLKCVGHPVVVNPDAGLKAIAREHGWEVMRFERLGRRLIVTVTTIIAAAAGGSGTWLAHRRRRRPRLKSLKLRWLGGNR